MNKTPHPDDGEPTVVMPSRSGVDPALTEVVRYLEAARRRRKRRLALAVVAAIVFLGGMAAGLVFLMRNEKSAAISGKPAPGTGDLPVTRPAKVPAAPPASRTPDKPPSLRQMLNETFEGRDRGHAVTAAVERDAVLITSSRPGYVYVLAASTSQADGAVLFVAMLFPRSADTNNRIRPGQTLKLPDLQAPNNAELLAIVSDERRDIDVLGSLAGKVICGATTPCSEGYGAVVFSSAPTRDTAGSPPAPTVGSPTAPKVVKPPAARPTTAVSPRCSDILERASLGEVLTADEFTFLRRDCR